MKETKHAPSPEGAAAQAQMMAAFEAYRAANDARLAAVEAKGAADPLLEEKVDRLEQALSAAQRRLDRAFADARRPSLGAAAAPEADERKAAFDGYLRTGVAAGLEVKGLSEGVSTAGGYVVTADLERLIDRRLAQSSPMRDIATVRSIGSGTFAKPVSTAGLTASWAAETAARTETAPPTLDLLSFPAADLYAAPAATQALLDDSQVNLDQWLADEVNDAFAGQETAAFVSGDGSGKPKGFLSYTQVADASQAWGQIGTVSTGVSGGFPASNPADKLLDLIYAPRASFRPNGRFVMNRRTLAAVRKFKDNNGDYILQPGQAPGQAPSIFGYPVTEIEAMPDIGAATTPIAFGDFRAGYLIVDRSGVRVLRDPYSAKPYVLFYTLKRVGGGVQNFDAVKLLKMS
jgi:HK97 family phage major capsid protein